MTSGFRELKIPLRIESENEAERERKELERGDFE